MSTYYYLICEDHREMCDGASRTAGGGGCHLVNSKTLLPPFIVQHASCRIRIASEHDEALHEYLEWTLQNVDDMIEKHGNHGSSWRHPRALRTPAPGGSEQTP